MYDMKRFMNEKLSVNFDNDKEYRDFIKCCVDYCKENPQFNMANHFKTSEMSNKALVYNFNAPQLQYGSDAFHVKYGWKSIKASELLICNVTPSKNDLMDFLTL